MLKSRCVLNPRGGDHIEVPNGGGVETSMTDSTSDAESDGAAEELDGEGLESSDVSR